MNSFCRSMPYRLAISLGISFGAVAMGAVLPFDHAERITIPVLIGQAKDDARVSSEQGRRMADRLKKLGKPVEYVEIATGGHSLNNGQSRLAMLDALESFLAMQIGQR